MSPTSANKIKMKRYFIVFNIIVFTCQLLLFYHFVANNRKENSITITMTTCNRKDLTIRTIESLIKYNRGKVNSINMLVDCYNKEFVETIENRYDKFVKIIYPRFNHRKRDLKHMNNIQQLFETVDTEWWVHLEDDWEFVREGFIRDSIDILSNSDLYMIIGREPNVFKPKVDYWIDHHHGVLRINSGPNGSFCSYSANAAVINTKKARQLIGNFSNYKGEWDVSKQLGKKGVRVGIFKNYYYKHIGDNMSTMHSVKLK